METLDLIVNNYMEEYAEYVLPEDRENVKKWIIDNLCDDTYKGIFVDVALDAIKSLYLCRYDFEVLNIYDEFVKQLKNLGWSISTKNSVVDMVAKYAKNGEKLYLFHHDHDTLNEKQLDFYKKIKKHHKAYNAPSQEQ